MSKQSLRSIVLGIPVVALCAVLTLPVLAAPPTTPAAPGFLARIWQSIEALISGPAPPETEPGVSELRRVVGDAGMRFEPGGYTLDLLDPTSSEEDSKLLSVTVPSPDDPEGTSQP